MEYLQVEAEDAWTTARRIIDNRLRSMAFWLGRKSKGDVENLRTDLLKRLHLLESKAQVRGAAKSIDRIREAIRLVGELDISNERHFAAVYNLLDKAPE